MKCKSIIEIEKELRKEKHEKKKRPFVPVATPGTKGHPLLSRTGVPGWETGTTAVSQPGQINVFVVVVEPVLGDGLILRDCHLGPRIRLAFQFMFHWSLSGKKQLAETFFYFL